MAKYLDVQKIAPLCLNHPKYYFVQLAATQHRIDMVERWGIHEGAQVLELGCGQGETTAVLAEAVGPTGHVTAVDPAPPTYGSPFTVTETRAFLSQGILGPQISWHTSDVAAYLANDTTQYDFAVFSHCLWYFRTFEDIKNIFGLLKARGVRHICIVEWSLTAPHIESQPHIFASLTMAALSICEEAPERNVRMMISPHEIKELAKEIGLVLEHETFVDTRGKGPLDGTWEVNSVLRTNFTSRIDEFARNPRERSFIAALRDATVASHSQLKGGAIESMDAWCAVFSPGT
ncbi:S-adenosyl-L-methionine-dependent methyltransferase [Mycena vulgaris]|nr:S-adenosyl-L-methionine-dependent methyltransferase [Mycena vulgaris]